MDIQTVSVVIAAIGLFIAAINQIYSNRQANQQRQADLFMQLYNRYDSIEFRSTITNMMQWEWTDIDDFIAKYGRDTNPESYNQFVVMQNYFEGIGVLVQRGLIDLQLVNDLLWNITTYFWEKFGPIYQAYRHQKGQEQIADHTEYLYNRIKAIHILS